MWTSEQLRTFLGFVENDRLSALWYTAAMTSMRRGELAALRWSDIDLDAARIAGVCSIVVVDYKPTISEPKTASGRRSKAMDAILVAALKAHKRRQSEGRIALGPAYHRPARSRGERQAP